MANLVDCLLDLKRDRENQNRFAPPWHTLLLHPCQPPQGPPLLLQPLLCFLMPLLRQLRASAFVVAHLPAVGANGLCVPYLKACRIYY